MKDLEAYHQYRQRMKEEGRTLICMANGCCGTGHIHKDGNRGEEISCPVCEGTGYVKPQESSK